MEYHERVGVTQQSVAGLLLAIYIFALVGTVVFAVPVYLVLRSIGLTHSVAIVTFGTCTGGAYVSLLDTGVFWRHPEGFAVGFIAAATFVLIRGRNNAI